MPPKPSRKRQWKAMLNRRIRELVELAREIDPEAEVQMLEPFEGEDAVLELRVIPEKSDEVYEAQNPDSQSIGFCQVTNSPHTLSPLSSPSPAAQNLHRKVKESDCHEQEKEHIFALNEPCSEVLVAVIERDLSANFR